MRNVKSKPPHPGFDFSSLWCPFPTTITIIPWVYVCMSSYVWLSLSNSISTPYFSSPVSWGCRIYQLHLCRGVIPPPKECPVYDAEKFDSGDRVMPCTTSLPSLPGPLWPGMVIPEKVLSMGQIELVYWWIYIMGEVLLLCRDAVGVLYKPSWLDHRTLVEGVLPICRDAVDIFYSPSRLGHRTLIGGVLPLCRDAVGVLYKPSWLDHRTLVGGVLPLCRDAVGVLYKPNWLDHRTLVGGVLPLCRDAVGVFNSLSRLSQIKLVNMLCIQGVTKFTYHLK